MRFGMGDLLSQVLTQLSGSENPKLQKVLQDGKRIRSMKSREICFDNIVIVGEGMYTFRQVTSDVIPVLI